MKKSYFLILFLFVFISVNAIEHKFVKNVGQVSDERVKGYVQLKNYTVSFSQNAFTYHFVIPQKESKHHDFNDIEKIKIKNLQVQLPQGNWQVEFLDSEQEAPLNYYKNGEHFSLQSFNSLKYTDKITGAALIFKIVDNLLKYDIILPQSYPSETFSLTTNARLLKKDKKIIYRLSRDISVEERFPEIYMFNNDEKQPLNIETQLKKHSLTFFLPKNRTGDIVIDPIAYSLKYGTYYGGNNMDYIFKVRVDSKKNSVLFGYTLSPDNIATAGSYQSSINGADYDMFVAKFDSLGNRLWATYYGGSGPERVRAGTIDANDNILIAGNTGSSSGVVTAGAHQLTLNSVDDACLVMLSPAGQLKWATYYGGDGHDFINDIDYYNGQFFMTGHTGSTNNITSAGAYQTSFLGSSTMAFYSIFDTTGTFIYGTYFGGGTSDNGTALAISQNGDVYVAGHTQSTSNIATAGTYQTTLSGQTDIFLSKWTTTGSFVWGTYYGDVNRDLLNSMTVFGNHIYLLGFTESTANMATAGAFQTALNSTDDGVLADFTPSGMLTKATYYGGNSTDYLAEIVAFDSSLYIFGYTSSSDFYTTADAFQNTYNNGFDNVFINFDTLLTPVFSTYYGGIGNENGHSIAPIDNYHFAVGGFTDPTDSTILTSDALQSTYGGFYYDGFYSIICRPVNLTTLNLSDSVALCAGGTINLQSLNTFPSYLWNTGATTNNITVADTGKFWLETYDIHNCRGSSDTVYVYEIQVDRNLTADKNVVCSGDSATISVSSSYSNYLWNTGVSDTVIYTDTTGNYFVSFLDSAGCTHYSDTISITAIPGSYNLSYVGNLNVCQNDSVILFWADSNALQSIFWNNIQTSYSIQPQAAGSYYASAVDTNGCTIKSDTLQVQFINYPNPILNFQPGGVYNLCNGDTLILQADTGFEFYNWSNGATSSGISVTTAGQYYVTVTDSNGCSATSDTARVNTSAMTNVYVTYFATNPKCYADTANLYADNNLVSVQWNNGNTNFVNQVINTSYYFYTGYDALGCPFASDTVFFEVYPQITDSIKLSDLPPYCDVQSVDMQLYHPNYFDSVYWVTGDTTYATTAYTTGYYYADMIDTNGCTAYSDTVYIEFLQAVQPVVSSNTDTLCTGDKLFVTLDNSTDFNSWLWDNGSTSATSVYNATSIGYLIVTLQATDTNGCVSQYVDTFIVEVCNSVEELAAVGVTLYPNPTTEYLTITSKSLVNYLAVYNMNGALMNEITNEQFLRKEISVKDYADGIYFIVFKVGNDYYSYKFLKE